jgi:hypothetical protein
MLSDAQSSIEQRREKEQKAAEARAARAAEEHRFNKGENRPISPTSTPRFKPQLTPNESPTPI